MGLIDTKLTHPASGFNDQSDNKKQKLGPQIVDKDNDAAGKHKLGQQIIGEDNDAKGLS
jgi:hypothetical protein